MPLPAWAAAAIPSVISGAASLFGGERANQKSAEEAQKNRDFQASQTSTAWQRGVKDMEAAGLNPALAYGQGPAASGGGSMATARDTITPSIHSAMAASKHKEEMANLKAQKFATEDSGRVSRLQGDRIKAENIAQGIGYSAQGDGPFNGGLAMEGPLAQRIKNEVMMQNLNIRAAQLGMPGLQNSARVAGTRFGRGAAYLRTLMDSGGGAIAGGLTGGLLSTAIRTRNKTIGRIPKSRRLTSGN